MSTSSAGSAASLVSASRQSSMPHTIPANVTEDRQGMDVTSELEAVMEMTAHQDDVANKREPESETPFSRHVSSIRRLESGDAGEVLVQPARSMAWTQTELDWRLRRVRALRLHRKSSMLGRGHRGRHHPVADPT